MLPVMSTPLELGHFYDHRLRTKNGLEDALAHLSVMLASDDVSVEQLVAGLLSVPNCFAYICTVFPEYPTMRNKVMDTFPTSPADLLESYVRDLLKQLSMLFFMLPPDSFAGDSSRLVSQYKHYVVDAWPALSVLLHTDFDAIRPANQLANARRRTGIVSMSDSVPLNNLGIGIPSNTAQARILADGILRTLNNILCFYFDLLPKPSLADAIRDAYFNSNSHPQLQLLRATLQVDNVEGFGQWNIIMSGGATKDLREIKRSDKREAEFVVNKISQLSKGRFSGNNQKRLNGPSHGIPIYQAEVLSNLRIVYQIDCVPDDDGLTEHQVIKIYRILTHKKLDHIWESLGNHLSKNKEYRDRCTFRQCASGTDIYIPASFPRRQMSLYEEKAHLVFSEDDSQVYSPFLLDKYVKFSKAYLNGLIADEVVQLPFQLTDDVLEVIQSTTSCFVMGRSGTGKTTAILYKILGIHRAWQKTSGCPKPRQVFVTKSRFLRAKVEESFNNLLKSLALAGRTREELKAHRAQNRAEREIDPLNALDCPPGTPQRFSELTDENFPLFITFDCLARLVAADLEHKDNPYANQLTCLSDKYPLVKYEHFVNYYWPRLPQCATRGQAPWLVFSEFMGVIKGSEVALDQPRGCLDQQTYMELPVRAYQTFAHQRETLYEIFNAYCFLKREERGYDMADRTHSILKPLLSGVPLKGQRVDYMYVDEVQDLLITDALLLRILCRNPNGLLWAGDTAQTISAGSSFRFEDLKAFIYRAERDDRMRLQMARKKPMVFQLTTNYRSHSGIINCAQAVIDIISRFWPDAIDTLRPEQGRTYGPRPMFFIDWEEGMNSPEQFFSQMKEKQIELGAEQCILVRDNATRGFLKQQVGDDALILTPEESKGLEFNDIFLYNFFEDSAAEYSQWRLVLAECGDSKVSSAFERDEDQFALLCTELRVLYVGITRAINNLYLLDKSNKSKPMRTFWSSRDLIRCTPVEANISHYVAESDPHEWVASGRKLFAAGLFKEAIRGFRRAGEPYRYELQRAALQLREDANRISPVSAACQTFLAAGEAFTACAEETLGVDVKVKLEYYNNAGDCYDRGGDVNRASASYILAKNFAAAARVYQHACHFNEIVQMFEQHYMDIAPHYNSTLFTVCRRHYGSKNIRPPKPLFPSIEEELDYLKRAGFDEARIDILEFHGRYIEAAEIHLHCGQPVKAIQSCLKAQQDETAFRFAVDIVLDSLWPWCSFVVLSTNKFSQKGTTSDILEIALNFPSERLSASECDQIRFFKALRHASEGEIYQLGCQFLRQGDDIFALAALDRAFSQFPVLNSADLVQMDHSLKQFETYVRLLVSVISNSDPLADQKARRVFGIIKLPNRYYGVQEGTFLYDRSTLNRFSRMDLNTKLKIELCTRLRQKATDEIQHFCRNPRLSAFSCLPMDFPGQYNARVSIHLRQICILQLVHDSCPQESWNESMRDWLLRLYDAIYPPLYFQGSIADIDLSVVEEVSGSCTIILQKWIEDTFQYLFSGDDFWKYLMETTRLARLALAFGGRLMVFDAIRIAKSSPFYWIPSMRPTSSADRFIIESIVKGLDGAEDDCISHGVSALQYMLHKGVRMDLSTIYDYLEEICSTLVISSLFHLGECSLISQDLVVPRKWLVNPSKFKGNKDTSSTPAFFAAIQQLLDRLRSGKAQKWFTHAPNNASFIDITVTKLCRLLCIVGYNTCDPVTSEWIADILSFSLRAEIVESNPQGTINVIHRSEYLSAIWSFDKDTSSDDLVQLIHKERSDTTRPVSPHIALVVYDDVVNIPRIVCRSPDISILLATQGPYIEFTGAEYTDDTDEGCKWSYPTEEVTAACRIQMAYRLHRVRCTSPTARLPWAAATDKFFMSCLEEVISLGWKPDQYRRVYLNKLPILLACLEQGMKITYTVRKETSENLWKETGKKRKDNVACITRWTDLINEGERLRKTLDPQAPLHDRPNMEAFRTAAKEVSKFIGRVPIDSGGWNERLKDAVDSVIADL